MSRNLEQHALTRRGLLGGIGATAGAVALGTTNRPAAAATAAAAINMAEDPTLDPTAGEALVAGLTYRVIDALAFTPRDNDSAWPRRLAQQGVELENGGTLGAPIDLPVGAILKQVTLFYLSPSASQPQTAFLQRKLVTGSYENLGSPVSLPQGDALQGYTFGLTQTVDGSYTYSILVNTFDATQFVGGLRVGYVPPPQAFVALTGVPRYDTRTGAGKLGPGEARIVNVGVPGVARAAVLNLTVTGTEAAGFVAVFAANIDWPGNSSINWNFTDQTVANAVISPVDSGGNIKIFGGVNKTHVVVDTQGYLL
jgi:hypothetical protein